MISDEPVQDGRMLADRQQAMFLRRNPDSGDCMGMKYARHIGPGAMDRAVDDESGRIDAEARRVVNDLPVDVDGDQIAGRNLVVHQSEGVDVERSEEHTSELQSLMRN